jgi:hypothetical protein
VRSAEPDLQRLKPDLLRCVYVVAEATTHKDSRVLTASEAVPCRKKPEYREKFPGPPQEPLRRIFACTDEQGKFVFSNMGR